MYLNISTYVRYRITIDAFFQTKIKKLIAAQMKNGSFESILSEKENINLNNLICIHSLRTCLNK